MPDLISPNCLWVLTGGRLRCGAEPAAAIAALTGNPVASIAQTLASAPGPETASKKSKGPIVTLVDEFYGRVLPVSSQLSA